jgi:hypothetical protein
VKENAKEISNVADAIIRMITIYHPIIALKKVGSNAIVIAPNKYFIFGARCTVSPYFLTKKSLIIIFYLCGVKLVPIIA